MTGSHCQLPGNASWYTSCSSPTVCKAWIPGNSSDFLCVECFWLEWWRSLVITQYQLILERPTSMGSQVAASVKSTSHWWNLCCCRDRLLLLQSEGNSKEQDTVWKDVLSWKIRKRLVEFAAFVCENLLLWTEGWYWPHVCLFGFLRTHLVSAILLSSNSFLSVLWI